MLQAQRSILEALSRKQKPAYENLMETINGNWNYGVKSINDLEKYHDIKLNES
jgi:hypothetical protein